MTLKMNIEIHRAPGSKLIELVIDLDSLTVMQYRQLVSFFRACTLLAMVFLVVQIASDILVGPATSIVIHALLLGLCKGLESYCRQEAARPTLLTQAAAETAPLS